MWRTLKSLIILAIVPGALFAQVSATLLERNEGLDPYSAVRALESSREALLQAREAVDAALGEVDVALEALRAVASIQANPPRVEQQDREEQGAWLRSLTALSANVRAALNERLASFQPVVGDLQWAAFKALEFQKDSEAPQSDDDSGGEKEALLQPAILVREEDAPPFPRQAFPGDTLFQQDTAFSVPEAPQPPVAIPTASVTEAAKESAPSTGTVGDMPTISVDIEPALPLALPEK